jgi:hypothetical protein
MANNLREELARVLPKDHPVLDKLDEEVEHVPDAHALMDSTEALVEVLQDWKRDIRDWSEVEEILDRARAELATFKETA